MHPRHRLGYDQGFFADGYRVIMNYCEDDDHAHRSFREINSKEAVLTKADITKKSDRENLLEKAWEIFGGFDVLVNNAAIIRFNRFLDISSETFEEVMNCNFYGVLYLAQAFSKKLVETK